MNILIDTIRIAGFRGIKNLEMTLPRVTLLIGMNNSGKTSVLKALQLALGDYSRYLSEEDFYIGSDDKRAAEIVVDVRIVPVDEQGDRIDTFDEPWQAEFEDRIQSEANSQQFVGFRTRSKLDEIKGGFDTSYSVLRKWTDYSNWLTERVEIAQSFSRLTSILFIPIDAQRDIHKEIREKSSLVGKILSSVKYDETESAALESLIKGISDQAISTSGVLTRLKTKLERLNQTFGGSGKAEITPFPRKVRDLSKYFSIHFGETENNSSFPMEYHGMGTRSWASMISMQTFAELIADSHTITLKQFSPILAAEEPEAHLHPNAQKTLYKQLKESKGQVIISTHSPYVAAMAKQHELRYLKRDTDRIVVKQLSSKNDNETDNEFHEKCRKLNREVIHSRGEILFSKAIVLCEGETEEQALPLLFKKYFGSEAFVMGVSFVGVGGSGERYLPFLAFGKDFDIPMFIFSDGETKTVSKLKRSYEKIYGITDISNCPNISILDGTDFEGYLISSGYESIIDSAIREIDADTIVEWEQKHGTSSGRKETDQPPCSECNQKIYVDIIRDYQSSGGANRVLMDILKSGKTRYAPLIAEKLCELEKEQLPPKILEFFQKLENGGII